MRPPVGRPRAGDAAHLPDRFLALTAAAFEYPRSDMKESIHFIGNLMPSGQVKTTMPVGGIRWTHRILWYLCRRERWQTKI